MVRTKAQRRARRHGRSRWSLMHYVDPETLKLVGAFVGKGLIGAVMVVAPAAAVKQQGDVKNQATAEAANASIAFNVAVMETLSLYRAEMRRFEREIKESRLQVREAKARLPEFAVGPAVPVKRHWWSR